MLRHATRPLRSKLALHAAGCRGEGGLKFSKGNETDRCILARTRARIYAHQARVRRKKRYVRCSCIQRERERGGENEGREGGREEAGKSNGNSSGKTRTHKVARDSVQREGGRVGGRSEKSSRPSICSLSRRVVSREKNLVSARARAHSVTREREKEKSEAKKEREAQQRDNRVALTNILHLPSVERSSASSKSGEERTSCRNRWLRCDWLTARDWPSSIGELYGAPGPALVRQHVRATCTCLVGRPLIKDVGEPPTSQRPARSRTVFTIVQVLVVISLFNLSVFDRPIRFVRSIDHVTRQRKNVVPYRGREKLVCETVQ